MKIKIRLPRIKSIFQLGLFLLILKVYGNASTILYYNDTIDTLLAAAGVACLIVHCLSQHYSARTLVIYGAFALLGLYNTMQVGTYDIFITIVVCLAARNTNIKKVVTFLFEYECLVFVLHLFYAIVRMFLFNANYISVINGIARYNMGFEHPNRFSLFVFNLLISWIWLHFSTLNYKNLLCIFAVSLIDYAITKTRTTLFAVIVLLFILVLYMKFRKNVTKLINVTAGVIAPALALFSIVLSMFYTSRNPVILAIDNLLSGRIRLGSYAYEHWGFSLFGINLSDFTMSFDYTWRLTTFTFDNIYTEFCMHQGVFWLILVCVLFFMLSRRKDPSINFAIIAWAIYGITEVHGMNVLMLFPIILVTTLFDNKKKITHLKTKKRRIKWSASTSGK